jgi:hypothetical protein
MKKTLFTILTIAMLLVGVAGQAMAYFDEEHLIRVVYNLEGQYEVITDLGAGYNYTTASTQNTVLNTNNFSLSQLGISEWSNVYVAYFALTTAGLSGNNWIWLSGTDAGLNVRARYWNSVSSATYSVFAGALESGVAQNVQLQTEMLAYSNLIGQDGDYFGYANTPTVHQSLSGFDAAGQQYVDQYLYYFALPNTASAGLQVATIRTYENGTTEINPVPLPAAVYLLGSGLLALVGIRRKTNLEA